jgi:hypothetical protein
LHIRLVGKTDRVKVRSVLKTWGMHKKHMPLLVEADSVLTTNRVNAAKENMQKVKTFWALLAGSVLLTWAPVSQAQTATTNTERKPGLGVCYMYKMIRHVDEIDTWEKNIKCEPGAPLANLDFYGGSGIVLTSNADDGVMARITGFIHLDQIGAYKFAFESNDGVRLKIDGKMIVEDPGVHDDQFSELGTMEVTKPGWYPLSVDFFERKITWTLRFLWRPPGVEGTPTPVPTAALAH